MIIVTDIDQRVVPELVHEQIKARLERKGFVMVKLLGGYEDTTDPAWIGRWTWYLDISLMPAITAADVNDLCEAVFPASHSGSILTARWSYIPTTQIVCVEQYWKVI